jgi:ABC-type sugar transport system permease subunit
MNHLRTVVFSNNNYGYGSALGWIYFMMIFMLLGIVFLLFRKSLTSMEGRG